MLHVLPNNLNHDPAVLAEQSPASCIVRALEHLRVIRAVVLDEHSVLLERDVATGEEVTATIENVRIDRRCG